MSILHSTWIIIVYAQIVYVISNRYIKKCVKSMTIYRCVQIRQSKSYKTTTKEGEYRLAEKQLQTLVVAITNADALIQLT